MTGQPQRGDVLIRQWRHDRYDLLDGETREAITTTRTLNEAISIAARKPGSVWREIVDEQGRLIGGPMLVLPRIRPV